MFANNIFVTNKMIAIQSCCGLTDYWLIGFGFYFYIGFHIDKVKVSLGMLSRKYRISK